MNGKCGRGAGSDGGRPRGGTGGEQDSNVTFPAVRGEVASAGPPPASSPQRPAPTLPPACSGRPLYGGNVSLCESPAVQDTTQPQSSGGGAAP